MEKVTGRLAPKFVFGYHSIEDIKQQAWIELLDGDTLQRYDTKRSLENFLFAHIHNRLFNLKRNKYSRYDKPCLNCPLNAYDPHLENSSNQCTAYSDKMDCDLWLKWTKRNQSKKNIMCAGPINLEPSNDNELLNDEVYQIVSDNMPADLRSDFLRMMDGCSLPKSRKEKIQNIVLEILEEHSWQKLVD